VLKDGENSPSQTNSFPRTSRLKGRKAILDVIRKGDKLCGVNLGTESAFKTDKMRNIPSNIIAALVRLYQIVISPLFPNSCRYYPSCSEYARQAFLTHGVIKGLAMSIWRILRCNPWSKGGYDPVRR